MKENNKLTTTLIARDFELELTPEEDQGMDEEALFALLADKVAYLIEYRIDFLLSLMYRLDIKEALINQALSPASVEPANLALARLILNRQKQRVFTKQHYKQDKLEDLGDLEF
ncbi:MAG: hypothetical protein AB8G15_16855 [Saprospiraceae bacterium]